MSQRRLRAPRSVSLRARTLGLVGGALLVLLALHYVGLRYAFVRAVTGLEKDSVTQQAGQVRSELVDALEDLDGVAADYASWDKTYAYIVKPHPDFVESDLADEALRHLRLEVALLVDAKGRIVLMRSLLPPAEAERLRDELAVHLAVGGPLTTFPDLEKGVRGFLRLPSRSLGLATRPILTSDGEGPARGTMVMARRLDGLVTAARDSVQITLDVEPLSNPIAPPPATLPQLQTTDTVDVNVVSSNRVDGVGVLRDIYDRPQWQTRISIDRSLHREAERWFAYFVLALILSAIAVAGVTVVLLDRHVLRRLTEVSRVVADIGTTGTLSRRLRLQGGDELADVGTAIDSMLTRIEASQHALEESEQRYRMAEQAALEAARVKAEFLANMSHEIRTPVNGVMGMLRLLEDTRLDGEQRESVETALRSTEGLLGVLNDILDFSKIEAGKLTLSAEPVAPRELAEQVMAPFGLGLNSKEVDLLLSVAPAVPDTVLGDPVRLRQILMNLVGNAVKFTPTGRVCVELDWQSGGTTPDALVIRVSDTGVGIPAAKLSAIFEEFTQADAATTRRFGGTGLGLAITRRLLTLMHGEIAVDSAPGAGATFTATIPLEAGPPLPRAPQTDQVVVLVDAAGLRRASHASSLRSLGFAVVEIETLTEAVQRKGSAHVIAVCPPADATTTSLLHALHAAGALKGIVVRRRESVQGAGWPPVSALVQPVTTSAWQSAFAATPTRHTRAPLPQFPSQVLLVEDNPVNRTVAVRLLRKLGCTVAVAVNGLEAVSMAAATSYDLIFMDCQMPELDGFEATERIRGLAGHQSPIVALTADALTETRARCLSVGMDDVLTKPFTPDQLREVLTRYLEEGAVQVRDITPTSV